MNIEQSITELESRIAFQENSFQEMNTVITRQQKQIDELREMVHILDSKLRDLAQASVEHKDEPPPHY